AGMDLRLHHGDRTRQLARRRLGLLGSPGDVSVEHGDPVFLEQLLGLVLVDVHGIMALPPAGQGPKLAVTVSFPRARAPDWRSGCAVRASPESRPASALVRCRFGARR